MRLTLREREIVEMLKKHPLASQYELAKHFGISRSSVAVHISNLMKKGVILGKGYVFNEQVSIVIVGLSYLDISMGHENQQIINVKYNGLPIQAIEILAGFGINLKVVSLVGNDEHGDIFLNRFMDEKIDTTYIQRHVSKRTCRRITLQNDIFYEEGFEPIDYEKVVNNRELVIFNSEWLIVDPYFNKSILKKAAGKDEEDIPCFCTYCFMKDKKPIPEFLQKYNLLVLGVRQSADMDHYRLQLDAIRENAPHGYIITDGRSSLIYNSGQTKGDYPLPPNQGFDIQSGLSGLLIGVVYGLSSGYPMRQAVRIGAGIASSTYLK